jgi:hypothetical protein
LTAAEAGLAGEWVVQEPPLEKPGRLVHYTVSWLPAPGPHRPQ